MLSESGRTIQTDQKFDTDVSNKRFDNHSFIRLIAKGKHFKNVDFKYSIFDTCYLRNCVFDSCDFTGCRFVGTNLYGSSFTGCKFEYSYFEKTVIDNDILNTGCPSVENLKMRFARTLRVNYQQLGDAKSVNKAMAVELQANEVYLYKAWHSNESYYRKKYSSWRRVKMLVEWVEFKLLDFIWGNGESVVKLIRTFVFVLLIISVVDIIRSSVTVNLSAPLATFFIKSPAVFFGVFSPENYPKWYLTIILFIRLVLLGFFMSIIIKLFNRR